MLLLHSTEGETTGCQNGPQEPDASEVTVNVGFSMPRAYIIVMPFQRWRKVLHHVKSDRKL